MSELLDLYESQKLFSGTVLVRRGGEDLLHEARGLAHRGFGVPNTVETRFDTASLGKLFTATAAIRLAGRGLLGLDERVSDIVDLTGTSIPSDVTIAQCLTHSSGIADDADEEAGEDYEALWRVKPCYAARETADLLENFAYKAPLFKAGTASRYNNCAYVLVGLAMEKRTGLPFRAVVEREVTNPLGLVRTGYFAKDGVDALIAEGYASVEDEQGRRTGFRKNIFSFPPIGSPDAGICTTAGDLAKLFEGLEERAYLGPELSARFLVPVIDAFTLKSGDLRRYGYCLEHDVRPSGETLRYGKDGCNPGVAAIAMRYPRADGFIAILANQDADVWSLCRELAAVAGFVA